MRRDIKQRLGKISDRLKVQYKAEQVILYGSHAGGKPGKDSDIDLLVIAPTKDKFHNRMATVRGLIRDLRKGLAVSPIVLTSEELERRIQIGDQFITEIMDQGIRL